MNKNLQKDLAILVFTIVAALLVIFALYQVIVKGRYDAGAFFLLSAWILYPFETKEKL